MSRYLMLLSALIASTALAQHLQFPRGEFPLTDFERSSVALSEIRSGGPPRDGIPAIDAPRFVDIDAAAEWLADQEPVIALSVDDDARAYPLQILIYHEIVNDTVGGQPVAVTFCPLCNASIVFDRTVDARVLDFGTTGRLRMSDLVMYDRQSESWWQQFTGRGIIGEYTDTVLEQLPSQIVSFGTFRSAYPDGRVLSRETGFTRPYGNNPYRGYDAIDNNPFLFDGDIDPRLPAMERVLSIGIDGKTHLLPLSPLSSKPLVSLLLSERPVVVFAASSAASALDDGSIADSRQIPAAAAFDSVVNGRALEFDWVNEQLVDKQTGSIWNVFGQATDGELAGTRLTQLDSGVHFAFAWLAFDPDAHVISLP